METWKTIFQKYQVSDLGNVKSLNYHREKREYFLAKNKRPNGYLSVHLCVEGKEKRYLVHRLVAEAFIPNPDNKPCINHINGDKTDNRIENLEWCTQSENVQHAIKNKLKKTKSILQYDLNERLIKKWNNAKEIEDATGIFATNIIACCRGKQKTARKYIWKYEDTQ